jgi:hypothetical protein
MRKWTYPSKAQFIDEHMIMFNLYMWRVNKNWNCKIFVVAWDWWEGCTTFHGELEISRDLIMLEQVFLNNYVIELCECHFL